MYCHAISFLLNSKKRATSDTLTRRTVRLTAELDIEYYEIDQVRNFI